MMAKKKKQSEKKSPEYYPRWSVYLVIAIIVVIVFGLVLRRRFISMGSFIVKPAVTPTITPLPTLNLIPPGKLGPSEQEYVDKAINALSDKLKIDENQIKVEKVESKKWNNTSLGCPERGKFYTEVITSGYVITLSAQGTTWTYHAGGSRVVTCRSSVPAVQQ